MNIVVTLYEGQVCVTAPEGVVVEVHDYNVPSDWDENVHVDSYGDRYEKYTFVGGNQA